MNTCLGLSVSTTERVGSCARLRPGLRAARSQREPETMEVAHSETVKGWLEVAHLGRAGGRLRGSESGLSLRVRTPTDSTGLFWIGSNLAVSDDEP